jgi:hypothetical protein
MIIGIAAGAGGWIDGVLAKKNRQSRAVEQLPLAPPPRRFLLASSGRRLFVLDLDRRGRITDSITRRDDVAHVECDDIIRRGRLFTAALWLRHTIRRKQHGPDPSGATIGLSISITFAAGDSLVVQTVGVTKRTRLFTDELVASARATPHPSP